MKVGKCLLGILGLGTIAYMLFHGKKLVEENKEYVDYANLPDDYDFFADLEQI